MTEINPRLASKGAKEPREGLVQQGNYHLELCKKHQNAVARFGFPPAVID